MSAPQLPPAFQAAITRDFPSDFLSFDESDRAEYGKDWTKVHAPNPSAIAFPRSTAEVAGLLRLCSEHRVAVVPSGGRTGLAGGAMAANGELVLSLILFMLVRRLMEMLFGQRPSIGHGR